MHNRLFSSLTIIIIVLSLNSFAQQPVIEIKSFEYSWNISNQYRVILALNDSFKLRLRNCFGKAFKERWNIDLPEVSISTKPLPFLASKPKFKTDIKHKEPGKWYLFLQVFENADVPFSRFEEVIPTSLDLRCLMVSSGNDSVIIDNALTIDIHPEAVPTDQVPLKRLAAYPSSFTMSFDSIATWLFSPKPISKKSLTLKPACIFQDPVFIAAPITKLLFHNDIFGIHQTSLPEFSLQISPPKYEKTGIKRNVGGRALGGLFTSLTGWSSVKTKSYKYKADYSYTDKDTAYHCFIGYLEDEAADTERIKNDNGSYSNQTANYKFQSRYIDPHARHAVMLGADTLATFSLTNKAEALSLNSYDKMWDGRDSTTIIPLPPDWNNKVPQKEVVILGKMGSNTFSMKTLKGKRIKDFYINNQLVTTLYGENEPVSGCLYQPVSTRQLKIFTILSTLPYAYFSVSN